MPVLAFCNKEIRIITKLDNLCYNFNKCSNAHCFRRMASCHTGYTFTLIVMLIIQFVIKNALNSKVFLGKPFQKKANAQELLSIIFLSRGAVMVNQQQPQLNGTKSVELENCLCTTAQR